MYKGSMPNKNEQRATYIKSKNTGSKTCKYNSVTLQNDKYKLAIKTRLATHWFTTHCKKTSFLSSKKGGFSGKKRYFLNQETVELEDENGGSWTLKNKVKKIPKTRVVVFNSNR